MQDYFVHHPGYMTHDAMVAVKAYNFESAAEQYAEDFNIDGDYTLLDSKETIQVIDACGVEKWFCISAESSIDYYSTEIEAPETASTPHNPNQLLLFSEDKA